MVAKIRQKFVPIGEKIKAYFVSDNCTFIWVGSDQVWVMFQMNYKGLKGRQNSPNFVTKWRFVKAYFVSDNCTFIWVDQISNG